MILRSEQEWLGLFKKHEQSGLSAAEFCREEKLCARYFSKRKRQLAWSSKREVKVVKPKRINNDFIKVSISKAKTNFCLEYGDLRLNWSELPPSGWLSDFIKTL